MNKKALLDYAIFARKELETQIALSLNKLGIYKDKILKANIVGDYTIIEGNPDSYPKRVYNLRKMMISEYFEGEEKFETVVEEFAYTWFNRLVAIRFMEVHDYFPHGFHVLTSRDGSYEPEILSNLPYVLSELNLEEEVIRSLRDQNKIEELYRYVLVKQCSALSKIVPDIFDVREPYLELLLPNNLLSQDSVIRKIELIPEEDFMNDVEVVGWLYQYYVQSNREEFRKAKVITKDFIPTLSQVFTPDWIVRYMADNSVGRLWLESYPNSSLKQSLKYYVEDAKQDEETQKKLDEIKYKDVNPEEIKIIEPCCGSGHILVYVFDLLLNMYLEQGYNKRDIPALILKNNLYGLDVDKRAAQLAKFSLVMKARSIDNRFFNEDRFVNPRVFEIKDSQLLIALNYKDAMKSLHFSADSIKLAEYLVDTFEYGKVIGSLLKVVSKDYTSLVDDIKRCKEVESPGIFEQDFYDKGLKRLRYLVRVARVLSRKYDVVITNPPYLGISTLEECGKNYLSNKYPDSKADMFAMFMEVEYIKKNGFRALVNPDSWMFLVSFENLRKKIIKTESVISMLHLGMGSFDAVVQTTTFVLRNAPIPCNGVYFRLVDEKDKEAAFLAGGGIIMNINCYSNIPGTPIAYWFNKKIVSCFEKGVQLSELATVRNGLKTGDNDEFVRFWYEVDLTKTFFNPTDYLQAIHSGKKWFMYNKGGEYRKWYGNDYYVVNWQNKGERVIGLAKKEKRNVQDYPDPFKFIPVITWSLITSSKPSFRYKTGNISDICGMSIYSFDIDLDYIIGFANTKLSLYILDALNPTLNYQAGDIGRLPILFDEKFRIRIDTLSKDSISASKEEWDDFEISHNFTKHPLV